MTKALIPKAATWLTHSQGWLAHACVPRCGCYGRAVAQQVAAGWRQQVLGRRCPGQRDGCAGHGVESATARE